MYHRITVELLLLIISFILPLKDRKKGLKITSHVLCLSSLTLEKEFFSSVSKACQLFLYLLISLLNISCVNISVSQCCSG